MGIVGFLIGLVASCPIAAASIAFQVCDDEGVSPLFIPDGVDLKPEQPHAGSIASFVITGDTGLADPLKRTLKLCAVHSVDGGTFHAEVFVGMSVHGKEIKVKLYEENKDLCSRTTCPIQKGPVEFHYDKKLPPITPPVILTLFILDTACLA